MHNVFHNMACRICGNMQNTPPWGEDGISPTYNICDCCGAEFGYHDCTIDAIKIHRQQWLDNGAKWEYQENKPSNWSLQKQLLQIPELYK